MNIELPKDARAQAVASIERWFEENASPKDLGGHDPADVARFLSGLTQSFMGNWVMQGTPPGQFTGRASLILGFFLNGVSGGKRKPTRSGEAA